MRNHTSLHFLQRLIRWGVPVVLLIAGSPPGKTQIKSPTASNPATLGTLVNGIEGGSCNSGTCAITGGKAKGKKLFHRLTEFWADSDYIDKVTVNNLQTANKPYKSVIISNIDDYGTYLNTALEFTTSNSDLIILSPGGIKLGSKAHFTNIGSLALSTAESLAIGDEVFHFKNSTESDLINMTAVIDLAQSAFQHNQAEAGQISIEIDDTLSIDADLILHSIGGIDIKAAEGSDASLDVGDTLNLSSNGKVSNEDTPYSIEIKDVTINADSISIEGNGGENQSLAIFIENADIYAANQIDIKGIGGNETDSINNENLIGLEIIDSTIESSTSGIYLSGIAGDGNEQISFADAYDFNNGTGLIVESSHIEAADGVIQLEGNGSFGSDIFLGHGIEIANSRILASEIVATGISAEASSDGQTDESNGIDINHSALSAVKQIDLTGASGNSEQNSSDIITSTGVYINNTDLNTSAGPIKIKGNGGSGESLGDSTGIAVYATDIRGSKIELTGTGGNTNDPENSITSIGVTILEDSTLTTRPSEADPFLLVIDNQDIEKNGDITISGYGGSGLEDSGGVFSTANIDSTGSIHIIGEGGVGQEDIYGVALETLDDNVDNGIIKTISADNQIIVKGEGGTGTDIVDSNGVYLSDVEVYAGKGIYLDGQAGSSIGETSHDEFLDGIFIENTNITINSAEPMTTDIANPSGANIILHGKPGSSDYVVEGSSGVLIAESTISTKGGIEIVGDGSNSESLISIDGDGILLEASTIKASSLLLAGYGATPVEPGFIDEDGNLVEQTSTGVEIVKTTIEINDHGGDFNHSIDIDGFGGGGNINVNGIILEDSTLTSPQSIYLEGKADDVDTSIQEGRGVSITDGTTLFSRSIEIYGAGSTGTNTDSSSGVYIAGSSITGSSDLTLIGLGGSSNDSEGIAAAADGISLVGGSTIISNGDIILDGKGGDSEYESTVSDGVYINETTITAEGGLEIYGKGGDGKIVETSNGVSITEASISSEKDLLIDGLGGDAEESVTEARGVEIFYSKLTSLGDFTVSGSGGLLFDYASDTNNSGDNQGIFLEGDQIIGHDINIMGYSGDGGSLITGIEMYSNNITATNTINFYGLGGMGETVLFAEGIYSVDNTISSTSGPVKFEAVGGSADLVKEGHGIISIFDIIKLSDDQSLTVKGKGAEAENQVDSQDNTGVTFEGTSIEGGRALNFIGIGGNGGKQNTGIELLDTDIISDGIIKLSGTGGAGTNIKKAIGVILGQDADEMIDDQIMGKLVGGSIFITGKGGTSNLRKNAIDQNGNDTFGETANNVGVVINQYELDANTGSLSVTGSGGELIVHKNKAEDQKISPNEESTAFKLEGLTINASKTTSSQATFLKGSGGKPISGSKNSGTTITNSTIKSAASTVTSPGPVIDLDIVDINKIDPKNANTNTKDLENRIEGNAFSGTNEIYGLTIDNTKIESKNRSLTLSGKGGLKATGERNYGIYIHNGSSITVGSKNNSHDLKIYGAGGDGTDMTGGILTQNTSYTGFGKIEMVGQSLESSGALSDAIEIFNNNVVQSKGDATFSGNNNVNVSNSSIKTDGDLNFSAKKDLNIDNSKISTDKNLNASAGNDVNIDNSKIDSEGDVNATAGNDINIDNSKIDSEGDVNATAGNDITVADSEINSNNTTLKADSIEIKETSLTSDQNLEIIAISGLDITSSELDASDAIALNSYSVAIESSTVKTSNLEVSSTELIQKDSSFEANSFTVNDDQSSDNDGNGSVQSLGLGMNTSLQTVDSQANNSEPTQSNSELTMSLAGGVNYILDDSAQESSSNDSQSSTTTSSSETTTSPATGSDESSSVDNESISSDGSADSESESEQAKSGGDDDQEGKDDAEDSSKDQKATKGSENSLPSQELSIKQAKQIHKESEAQSSKFVAKQLGLPERPAMSIQEIQGMLSSGMDSMNNNRQ